MKKREAALLVSLFCCISMAAQLPVLIQQKWNDATTAETLKRDFKLWRQKGVTGVCFDAGTDCDRIALAAHLAHEAGLEYHAWVSTMAQKGLPREWYTVSRMGLNASEHPAYGGENTTLDPQNREVHKYLVRTLGQIASIKDVDGVQLGCARHRSSMR